jgi:hypothetical protein
MLYKRTLFKIGLVVFLSGCATYTKEDCVNMDWKSVGWKAAYRGDRLADVQSRFDECSIQMSNSEATNALISGFNEGLTGFCTTNQAFKFARNGGEYRGTCSGASELAFKAGYNQGRSEYLEAEIARLRGQVNLLESEVSNLQGLVGSMSGQLSFCGM